MVMERAQIVVPDRTVSCELGPGAPRDAWGACVPTRRTTQAKLAGASRRGASHPSPGRSAVQLVVQTERIFNNRYRVDGTLGNGGMANVYVGTDTLLRRRVAIKVLREQYASDEDFVRRFSYEAQSAAKLSHPNIVNVYDFGQEDHSYYIVMELVDGATLGDIMRDERVLPEPVAVDYAIQIASGLAYAHRQGLLHRDVKPANILVTKDDVVKLSDFGIARAVSEHTLGVTQPGMVMGSVAYISPEQAQGHDIDERSDLYSVGVVLYQMLTGTLPFNADTPVAVALKHVSEEPAPIDPASGVSVAVASIVSRLLRKNPDERFASATELASALREARERPNVAQTHLFADAPTSRFSGDGRAAAAPVRRAGSSRGDRGHRSSTTSGTVPDRRWIVFPVLLAVAIAIGFFAMRGPLFGPAKNIAVPRLEGMGATQAQQRLVELGLVPNVTSAAQRDRSARTRDQSGPAGGNGARAQRSRRARRVRRFADGRRARRQGLQRRRRAALAAQREAPRQAAVRVQRHRPAESSHRPGAAGRHVRAAELRRHARRVEGRQADRRPERRQHERRRRARATAEAGAQARRSASRPRATRFPRTSSPRKIPIRSRRCSRTPS